MVTEVTAVVTEVTAVVTEVLVFTCVGVMVLTSSEARLFSRVVFPALSSPSRTILSSVSVEPFSLWMTESKPWWGGESHRVTPGQEGF